jgi:small subunit ribosomal protein S21
LLRQIECRQIAIQSGENACEGVLHHKLHAFCAGFLAFCPITSRHGCLILLSAAPIRGADRWRKPAFGCAAFSDLNRKTGSPVQVLVRDNNVDQALRALKKKMQREGIFREMKMRGHYEKPSEKRAREKAEAVRRARKLARKRAQREGLLPMTPRPAVAARPAR